MAGEKQKRRVWLQRRDEPLPLRLAVTAKDWNEELRKEFGAQDREKKVVLKTAADVLNLVEKFGRFTLDEDGWIEFENVYD